MPSFQAYTIREKGESVQAGMETLMTEDLPQGDVLIRVHYSSVNYKDGMVAQPNNPLVKNYPVIPGIDLAGEVVESTDNQFSKGDQVIATSYEIGVNHFGGYSEYARIPSQWIVPLPQELTLEQSMIYGTAGFTAALSIERLQHYGITPEKGPVLVTGATGGVGSMAVAMLAKQGYEVEASTGSESYTDFLKELGAAKVISRKEVFDGKLKPLDKEKWAAAVDPVGGEPLAAVLSQLKYFGAAAVSGLAAGTKVPTEVYPFILRGIALIGVDSVQCPMDIRKDIWDRLASDLNISDSLEKMKSQVSLEEVPETLEKILNGQTIGRTIVKV
ncbi:oxidoreductase [Halobacillus salinarum]|uniref:Oxidoreductase n=1 Tax=Halobacillus salinarum TaxID=2932257 RepID=A0ABY4EK23_9BACI|nr:oxidoreductase [Halobacillus salinarum]UOQ43862.1 oxidoreductase [Halobacillus salinarum]